MAERPPCPRCGSELPARAPQGLCPRCLLREGLDGEALSLAGGGVPAATVSLAAGPDGASVLETLAASVGPVPRVLLRDTDPAEVSESVIRPGSDAMPAPADHSARLRLLGEMARGGMGAVLKGRDEDLGRDLAVKVLLERHRDNPELIRRFVEEAQIAGQLQHPGIAPIYELGAFADRRPYFTMKLIKGRTLADLLRERAEPPHDLPRLLGIFEQVCQTMAYAHARGVIHRDLKPSNVMVGSFGEVQVMDWGLAKVLPRGGASDDATAGRVGPQETVVATARSGSDSDLSRAGSVMGTPSYMAPEQARGEVDRVDERADVFALGSILCEILSGRPAFTGRTSAEIQRRAAAGDMGDALARLDACGADAELIGLARDCLAIEPEGRPRDAGAVSGRVVAHLAGVQERLRAAELERATEAARAEEALARAAVERSRRRRTIALAAAMLVSTTFGGVAITYVLQERRARFALAQRIDGEVVGLLANAQMRPENPALWHAALASLRQVDTASFPSSARTWLDDLRRRAQAGFDSAQSDQPLLTAFDEVRAQEAQLGRSDADQIYSRAFRDAGLNLDTSVSELAAALRARPAGVVPAAVAALDDWALALLCERPFDPRWRRLLEIARAADPDPFRGRVRDALLNPADSRAREATLRSLAADPSADELPPQRLATGPGTASARGRGDGDDPARAGGGSAPGRLLAQLHDGRDANAARADFPAGGDRVLPRRQGTEAGDWRGAGSAAPGFGAARRGDGRPCRSLRAPLAWRLAPIGPHLRRSSATVHPARAGREVHRQGARGGAALSRALLGPRDARHRLTGRREARRGDRRASRGHPGAT
jgi:serine/threonine-protein kinase